jgi:hypothetical protein
MHAVEPLDPDEPTAPDEVNAGLTLEWHGEVWRLSGEMPSQMLMLEMAHLAEAGADTEHQEAFALIFEMLEELVHPDDWTRFRRHARRVRATGDDLMYKFAGPATEAIVGHPTKRSSSSSDGPQPTHSSSTAASSPAATVQPKGPAEVIEDLNRRGRSDLAQMVRQRHALQPA